MKNRTIVCLARNSYRSEHRRNRIVFGVLNIFCWFFVVQLKFYLHCSKLKKKHSVGYLCHLPRLAETACLVTVDRPPDRRDIPENDVWLCSTPPGHTFPFHVSVKEKMACDICFCLIAILFPHAMPWFGPPSKYLFLDPCLPPIPISSEFTQGLTLETTCVLSWILDHSQSLHCPANFEF